MTSSLVFHPVIKLSFSRRSSPRRPVDRRALKSHNINSGLLLIEQVAAGVAVEKVTDIYSCVVCVSLPSNSSLSVTRCT